MTSERPWARHYLDDWQARAGDDRLPYWLRVAALAYGSHLDNGHANFKRGEIAMILASVDRLTGEIAPYRRVGRAIDDAVRFGWLEPDSAWWCLVVPAHSIRKGPWQTPKPCLIHTRKRTAKATNTPPDEQFDLGSSPPDEQFEARTRHQMSSSERAPLSLIWPVNPTNDRPGMTA